MQKVVFWRILLTLTVCRWCKIEVGKTPVGGLLSPPGKRRPSTMQASSVQNACSVRPQCLFRPSTMLVPSVHNACSVRPQCLFRPCRMLVRLVQKPCSGLWEGWLAPLKWLWEAVKWVFPSLGSCFSLSFKCKDFAILLPCCWLWIFVPVFSCKPDRRPK